MGLIWREGFEGQRPKGSEGPWDRPVPPNKWRDLVADLEEPYDGPAVWQLDHNGMLVSIFLRETGWTTTAFTSKSYWWQDRELAPAGTPLEDAKKAAVRMVRAHVRAVF